MRGTDLCRRSAVHPMTSDTHGMYQPKQSARATTLAHVLCCQIARKLLHKAAWSNTAGIPDGAHLLPVDEAGGKLVKVDGTVSVQVDALHQLLKLPRAHLQLSCGASLSAQFSSI